LRSNRWPSAAGADGWLARIDLRAEIGSEGEAETVNVCAGLRDLMVSLIDAVEVHGGDDQMGLGHYNRAAHNTHQKRMQQPLPLHV
jgi:hypothetical protein